MRITAIKQQVKRTGRYSIFVDGKYGFSLSADALLESRLASGDELTDEQVDDYKQKSSDDKLYNNVLNYLSIRPRSQWEIEQYLKRKKAPAPLFDSILNMLSISGRLDDKKFAEAWVRDRQLLRPASRRKILAELRAKHVSEEVARAAIGEYEQETGFGDSSALEILVAKKRKQARYQDNEKLMAYLARQGFSYDAIKQALN